MAARRVVVVADTYTVYAFRLLGVEGYSVNSPREAARVVESLIPREDVGLVLLSAEYFDEAREAVDRFRRARSDAVIARLPTVREPGRPMDVQRELLRALGMG
ncbi:hypothetical protein CF15_05240 [Pyrodictium occultum]|uniref:ATP synthase subunit F n=1 Tax=Pyrodictium occultum TaxID=2309 RepID=A0A0V8RVS6_PYROC|nr:V-type ATP synthase subunit F [Pyrodictium occultum]KSW12167.1 hypothetical protein CF15_05240 [Pyrodictium occultum]